MFRVIQKRFKDKRNVPLGLAESEAWSESIICSKPTGESHCADINLPLQRPWLLTRPRIGRVYALFWCPKGGFSATNAYLCRDSTVRSRPR